MPKTSGRPGARPNPPGPPAPVAAAPRERHDIAHTPPLAWSRARPAPRGSRVSLRSPRPGHRGRFPWRFARAVGWARQGASLRTTPTAPSRCPHQLRPWSASQSRYVASRVPKSEANSHRRSPPWPSALRPSPFANASVNNAGWWSSSPGATHYQWRHDSPPVENASRRATYAEARSGVSAAVWAPCTPTAPPTSPHGGSADTVNSVVTVTPLWQ